MISSSVERAIASISRRLENLNVPLTVEALVKVLVDFVNKNISYGTPEEILYTYIDLIFSPQLIVRNLGVIAALQFILTTSKWVNKLWRGIFSIITKKGTVAINPSIYIYIFF
jgi:hypothetical protein